MQSESKWLRPLIPTTQIVIKTEKRVIIIYIYFVKDKRLLTKLYYHTFIISDILAIYFWHLILQNKTPHVVTVLWQDSDDVMTILSPTRNLVEGYKTVYLCHLDSYTETVCNGYLVSSHVVTVLLPTRCLVDRFQLRFLHRPHGSGYLITCVSDSHCS